MEAGQVAERVPSAIGERVKESLRRRPWVGAVGVILAIFIALVIGEGLHAVAQTGLNGLSLGAIYALGAVGLTLVYGILKLVNFAHGDFLTFGAYMAYLVNVTWGAPLVVAVFWAMIMTALLGLLFERLLWGPMRQKHAGFLQLILMSIGLAFLLRAILQWFWSTDIRVLDVDTTSTVDFFGLHIGQTQLVAVIVGIVFLIRVQRSPELQQRTKESIDTQLEKPLLRPLAPYLRAAWRRIGRPLARRSEAPARFVWNRFTPGELGLEVTTLLAIAAVGAYVFVLLGMAPEGGTEARINSWAFDVADSLYSGSMKDVVVWVTALGSLPVVALVVASTSLWAAARRRYLDALALVVSLMLTWPAVDIAKAAYDRPRPADPHVVTNGASYPSGHSGYAVAWVACAVVLVRAGAGIATRFAIVTAAVVLAVVIALTRVYLRAHYLSDVAGALGLGAAIFALVGAVAVVVGHLRQNGEPPR